MTIEKILKLRQEAGGLNKLMHMHVVTLDEHGGATVELELTEELLNPLGMAHGGTIFTLCDIAAGSAAASLEAAELVASEEAAELATEEAAVEEAEEPQAVMPTASARAAAATATVFSFMMDSP